MTMGVEDLGLSIYHHDVTNYDLNVVHCSNLLCRQYVRRR
jgi:hypothetical protein